MKGASVYRCQSFFSWKPYWYFAKEYKEIGWGYWLMSWSKYE